MGKRTPDRLQPARRLIGAVAADGDYAQILVCTEPDASTRARLVADRAVTPDELPSVLAEMSDSIVRPGGRSRSRVEWITTLAGDAAHHEVAAIPPQVRAFPDARIDAALAGTRWSNTDAVEESGYRLSHSVDGDRCLIAIARESALEDAGGPFGGRGAATTAAAGLAELVRIVRPELFDPAAAPSMALLCERTAIAAAIVDRGAVSLLHQVGLLEYFQDLDPLPTGPSAAPEPSEFEFELGGGYSIPKDRGGPVRLTSSRELRAADIESDVYQAAIVRVIQEVMRLYSDQYGAACEPPRELLLTGECVTRHALRALLARQLGSQFAVDEMDVALAVRIDEPGEARRIAAGQNALGGALCALAAGMKPGALAFDLGSTTAAGPPIGTLRHGRPPILSRTAAVAVLAASLLFGAGFSGRYLWVKRVERSLTAEISLESKRAADLKVVTDERKVVEARVAHTRTVLAELNRLRSRQALPPELLDAIRSQLPPGATLDEVSLANGIVRIVGTTEHREKGAQFARSLERMHDMFLDVTPQVALDSSQHRSSRSDLVEEDSYTFTITARYVRSVAPPPEVAI